MYGQVEIGSYCHELGMKQWGLELVLKKRERERFKIYFGDRTERLYVRQKEREESKITPGFLFSFVLLFCFVCLSCLDGGWWCHLLRWGTLEEEKS